MEPLFHLIIAPLFLMAFFPKINKKLILILSPLAVLPDFDLFAPALLHRTIGHNIFFITIITITIYITISKLAGKIALFFLSSHLIMDLNYWGCTYLWPIYSKAIYLHAEITRDPITRIFKPVFEFGTANIIGVARTSQEMWLSTNAAMLITLIIVLTAAALIASTNNNLFKGKARP